MCGSAGSARTSIVCDRVELGLQGPVVEWLAIRARI
jgi:hypothetical protein